MLLKNFLVRVMLKQSAGQGRPMQPNGCGYEQKALVAQSADVSCGTLAGNLSRRQDTMAQFLQIPANDKTVPGDETVQSRF